MAAGIVEQLCANGLIVVVSLPYNRLPVSDALVIDRSESFPTQEVLTLSGPLTAPNGPIFLNAMRREEPTDTLILDLKNVPYVDSAGIGLLVTTYVSRTKTGRQMVLTGLNPRVQKLFEITRVASLFLVFSSPQEAIAALGNAAQA